MIERIGRRFVSLLLTFFTVCTFRLIGFYAVLMLFSHRLLHLFLADILA